MGRGAVAVAEGKQQRRRLPQPPARPRRPLSPQPPCPSSPGPSRSQSTAFLPLAHLQILVTANTSSRPRASTVRVLFSDRRPCSVTQRHAPSARFPNTNQTRHWCARRCFRAPPVPDHVSPQLPELHRLLQVYHCQGRRLCPMQAVQTCLQLALPQCVLPPPFFRRRSDRRRECST